MKYALFCACWCLWSAAAHAEPAAPPARSAALRELAQSVAAQLQELLAVHAQQGTVVACAQVRSDEPLPRAAALTHRACAALAAALPNARWVEEPISVQSAQKYTPAGTPLTFVEWELAAGQLHASVEVRSWPRSVWARLQKPAPAPLGQAYAAAPIDAELRSFLPQLKLEQASLRAHRHALGEVQALACAPLADAPGNQLALWTKHELVTGRLASGALQVSQRVSQAQIGRRTPVPMRPPLASVIYTGNEHAPLAVSSSDRHGALLDRALVPLASLDGLLVDVGASVPWCAPWEPLAGATRGRAQPCDASLDAGANQASEQNLYDAQVGARWSDRHGQAHQAFALRERSGRLSLWLGAQRAQLSGVGAQLALGDWDQDGLLELIYTLDRDEDALSVATFDGAQLRLRKRWSLGEKVRALALCPPESSALPTLVAVGDRQIWTVR